jgi:hypothetical protein
MKMKKGLAACLAILILGGCSGQNPVIDASTPSLASTPIPTSTGTATSVPDLPPTSTAWQWLPYDQNPSRAGCTDFVATLAVQGTQGLSQEEIFKQLFEGYLSHFRSPDLGGICRLEDYRVENVLVDQKIAFLAAEQHLDRVASLDFSVQVSSEPTDWVAGNGELAAQGWVIHKFLIVGYTKSSAAYILKIIGTGP